MISPLRPSRKVPVGSLLRFHFFLLGALPFFPLPLPLLFFLPFLPFHFPSLSSPPPPPPPFFFFLSSFFASNLFLPFLPFPLTCALSLATLPFFLRPNISTDRLEGSHRPWRRRFPIRKGNHARHHVHLSWVIGDVNIGLAVLRWTDDCFVPPLLLKDQTKLETIRFEGDQFVLFQ